MPKTRILFTIPNFRTAGSQYVLLSLLRGLDKSVFDPFVCVEKRGEKFPEEIPLDRRLYFEWKGSAVTSILTFNRFLRKNGIDVIHSWDYKSNFLESLAATIAKRPYVYTKKNNTWSRRWKLKSLFSTHIVYDNPEMKKKFFDFFLFRRKVSFIPHGINTDVFKPIDKMITNTYNLGCIGNIGENKNQLFIIKCLKDLPGDVVLHLYGKADKNYRATIEEYLTLHQLNERVIFHGFIPNDKLPEVFRQLDLCILASQQEGMPVSILEALACGIPVLASDSGGGAKFILEKGGGYIFSLGSTEQLIKYISQLYGNPQKLKALSLEGRRNILRHFLLEKEIASYEKIYKKLSTKRVQASVVP